MRVLSLFSGGGLGDYGLELAGMEIVGQVEIDDYCQKILKLRWPEVPKWTDIKDFDGEAFVREHGQLDLISGGFPCQDLSYCGSGSGLEGERSGLWKEMFRIVCEIRPRYILVENVTALLARGVGRIFADLAAVRYDCEWDCLSASAFGANHFRDRVFIIGKNTDFAKDLFSPILKVRSENANYRRNRKKGWWSSKPGVPRVVDGTPKRMDRHAMCGNGQVVQVVEWIGERIMEFDNNWKKDELRKGE